MNRILIFLVIIALAAGAVLYSLHISHKTSTAAVASLLPRNTVAFAHLPDFNRTRDGWHQSDIYQLYREPAVQDFLGKPLSRLPKKNSASNAARQIQELGLSDGFIALTSMANDNVKVVAGFRFRGSSDDAEKIIGPWRSKFLGSRTGAAPETAEYEHHKIETTGTGSTSLNTVYDGNWFLAANDLEELKALLDRVDGRAKDAQTLLSSDDSYREAIGEMPPDYAFLFYLQPKILAEKLAALRNNQGQAPDGSTFLEQSRSICGSMRFDHGKIHDVVFVGVPKQNQKGELSRSSLALASRDTFLYAASLVNPKQLDLFSSSATGNLLGDPFQKIARVLTAVSPEDWEAAFGSSEFGFLSDWSGDKHWPSAIATCTVKDAVRAKKLVPTLLHALDEDSYWTETDRNGVHYWVMRQGPNLFGIKPAIGLSDKVMVAGLDDASIEAALNRAQNPTFELSNSDTYKHAARSLPEPSDAFAYIDLGRFYTRLDATLRPMLLMSAAFMPAINDYADVGKLPAAEVITRHLSPIVTSRRYNGRGYVAESIGPITMDQAFIGGGAIALWGGIVYRQGISGVLPGVGLGQGPAGPTTSGRSSGKGVKVPNQALPTPMPTPKATP